MNWVDALPPMRTVVGTAVLAVLVAAIMPLASLVPTGLGAAFLLGLGLFAWIGAIAVGLVAGVWKRRRRTLAYTGIWTAALALTIVAMALVNRRAFRLSEERGEAIVSAIERFEVDRGRRPGTLGELVPTHLAGIPVTAYGLWTTHPFYYRTDAQCGWVLSFEAGSATVCFRTPGRPWVCDD